MLWIKLISIASLLPSTMGLDLFEFEKIIKDKIDFEFFQVATLEL